MLIAVIKTSEPSHCPNRTTLQAARTLLKACPRTTMSTYSSRPFSRRRRRRRRKNNTWIFNSISQHHTPAMSSRLDSDRQYDLFHSSWLASQRDGPFNVGGLGGGSHVSRYGDFDQFNRSSMVLPRQSTSSTADSVDHIMRIVAEADSDMLLRSGNEAYANALSVHNGTKAELASLQYVLVTLILIPFL